MPSLRPVSRLACASRLHASFRFQFYCSVYAAMLCAVGRHARERGEVTAGMFTLACGRSTKLEGSELEARLGIFREVHWNAARRNVNVMENECIGKAV